MNNNAKSTPILRALCCAVAWAVIAPLPATAQAPEAASARSSRAATQVYSGAWFDVRYPRDFSAQGSMRANWGEDKYDSARFTSPDGQVTFYVYSPQWKGEPTDIAPGPGEREVSREVKRSEARTVTFWTIAARDGSRTRSYQKIEEHASDTSWVFGIEYADQAAYQRYRQQYLQFKQSLQQFADA